MYNYSTDKKSLQANYKKTYAKTHDKTAKSQKKAKTSQKLKNDKNIQADDRTSYDEVVDLLQDKYKPKKNIVVPFVHYAVEKELISPLRAYGKINKRGYVDGGIVNCSNYLAFGADKDFTVQYLYKAHRCRWRFCPVCTWRLSKMRSFVFSVIAKKLAKLTYRFVMVTLTIPNVPADELGGAIDDLSAGWQRLIKRKKYKYSSDWINKDEQLIVGGIRALEVTYNEKRNDYHPHLHILLCVKAEYFAGVQITDDDGKRKWTYPNMIDVDTWRSDWQKSVRNPRAEQIHVKAVPNNKFTVEKTILEVTKYMAKEQNMFHSPEVFHGFYKGLVGRHLFTPFGIIKSYRDLFLEDKHQFADVFDIRKPVEWYWKLVGRWNVGKQDYNKIQKYRIDDDLLSEEIQKRWLGDIRKEDLEEGT